MIRQSISVVLVCLFSICVTLFLFTVAGCGGGSGGGDSSGGGSVPVVFSINTAGGDGGIDNGTGGFGGPVQILKIGGTGSAEVLGNGTVDASFAPTSATPDLGANPLSIAADTTISVAAAEPASGTPYLVSTDSNLYISDGNLVLGNEAPVTGLSVAAGTTLTLALNEAGTSAHISFTNDVQNNGTITTADVDPTQRGGLVLAFLGYYGSSDSLIDTSGITPGQNGGSIWHYTLGLPANTDIYNLGRFTSAGADNAAGAGGNGGDIAVGGFNLLENSGAITSAGGTGNAGNGGNAGNIRIVTGVGYLYNSGALVASGGNGTFGGGFGGSVTLTSATGGFGNAGELRNSGAVNAAGGQGAGSNGGDGGAIEIKAQGGDFLNNAGLDSSGGNTSESASVGGRGGAITVGSFPTGSGSPAGNAGVAGDLDSSGGDAVAGGSGDGGDGGQVMVVVDASGAYSTINGLPAPTTQKLSLLSYATIYTTGGSGNFGGPGGVVVVVNDGQRWDSGSSSYVDDPGGDLTNQADIIARGGSVSPGATALPAIGGPGGLVQFLGDTDVSVVNAAAERVNNSGNIDTSGGDSQASTGPAASAGPIILYSTNDVTNSGNLTGNGGNDSVDDDNLATGFGGQGAVMQMNALQATATNSGTITLNGGNGEAQGGMGTAAILGNEQVINSGSISVRGGSADTALPGSIGGDGGDIVMIDADTPDQTGSLNFSGGAGDTAGVDGGIITP